MKDETYSEDDALEEATYVSRKEAARILKVTQRTVIVMEGNGYLTPIKRGDGDKAPIFYASDEVEELRTSRRQGSDGPPLGMEGQEVINDAAMNMAMAPSAIIRAFAKAMETANTHVVGMMNPLNEIMKMNMELMSKENRRLTDRMGRLEAEIFEFIDLQKTALREDHEGRLLELNELESQKMKREAFSRVMGYAPLLATLVGDKLGPAAKVTVRESALVDIIDNMDIDKIEALQKAGVFGQAEMATIVNMKDKLEQERAQRLQAEVDSAEKAEKVLDDKAKTV